MHHAYYVVVYYSYTSLFQLVLMGCLGKQMA